MAIALRDIQAAKQSFEERVLTFLQRDMEQAFTLMDIYAAMENVDVGLASLVVAVMEPAERAKELKPVEAALASLEHTGKIRRVTHGGETYFHAVSK